MNQDGSLAALVFTDHSPVEGQERCGIVWHSMVRPGCEVEVVDTK